MRLLPQSMLVGRISEKRIYMLHPLLHLSMPRMPNLFCSLACRRVTVNNKVTKELLENVYALDLSGMLLCTRLLCYCVLLKRMSKELFDAP